MRSTAASAARSCSGRWRTTRPGGLHRGLAIELARRALAPGNLLASGSIAFYYAVNVLPRSGLLDEAVSIFNQALAQARRRGDIFNVAFMLMWRGHCQTRRGDLRAAVADLREALDLCVAHGMLVAWPYNIGFLAHGLLEQGNADEAARVIEEGDFPEQLPLDQVHLVWFRLSRGRLRIETGSPERGVAELLQVGETVRLVPFDNPTSVPWRSCAAEGLRLLDRNDEAHALAEEELALARRWGDPHAIGATLRVLGLVEGGTAGIAVLQEAVEVLTGSEARLAHARALVDLGAALRRANQRTEARERLQEGVDLARRVGAFGLAERANEEIAATGARPRKVLQTGLDALTASERRVRTARRRRDEQQRDRTNAVRDDQDDRGASEPRLPQARDRLPRAAPQGPPDSRTDPGAHLRLVAAGPTVRRPEEH